MKVASSLVSGLHPTPELAAEAVRNALQGAGLQRADSVLLFLTRDYVRHAQPAIVAAARAAGTLQVSGCTAFGLLTEQGWLLDQPGAAALVFAHPAPAAADGRHATATLVQRPAHPALRLASDAGTRRPARRRGGELVAWPDSRAAWRRNPAVRLAHPAMPVDRPAPAEPAAHGQRRQRLRSAPDWRPRPDRQPASPPAGRTARRTATAPDRHCARTGRPCRPDPDRQRRRLADPGRAAGNRRAGALGDPPAAERRTGYAAIAACPPRA